jgi:hypothetical protein
MNLSDLLAHHEQSETTQNDAGSWINVYGRKTPQAGLALPQLHDFEQPDYADEPNAVAAAILRSLFEGRKNQFLRSYPGR